MSSGALLTAEWWSFEKYLLSILPKLIPNLSRNYRDIFRIIISETTFLIRDDFFGQRRLLCKSQSFCQACRYIESSTLWSASSRSCDYTKFHQNPAYVTLSREKNSGILICVWLSKNVIISGIARCDPPRHVVVVIPSFIKIRLM